MHSPSRAFAAIALGVVALAGCQSSPPPPPPAIDPPDPDVLTERDLEDNGGLYFAPGKTLLLSLEGASAKVDPSIGDTGRAGEDEVRFFVDEPQAIELCVDASGENDAIAIVDGDDTTMLGATSGQCHAGNVDAGEYRLRATRDPGASDAPPAQLFVHAKEADGQCDAPPDPFARANNRWMISAPAGWLQGPRDTTPGRVGIGAPGTFDPDLGVRLARGADGTVQVFGAGGLPGVFVKETFPLASGTPGVLFFPGHFFPGAVSPMAFDPLPGVAWGYAPGLIDGGKTYRWSLIPGNDAESIVAGAPGAVPFNVTFAMRVADRYEDVLPLATGEVAFAGAQRVFVLNEANAFPTDFAKVVGMTALGGFGLFAIAPGCDTSVFIYSAASFGGRSRFVGLLSDYQASIDLGGVRSARVVRTKKLLIETNKCTGCNLARADLRGYSLKNVQLTNVDLSGAKLTGVVMDGAALRSVNLDRAELTGASLLGATFADVGLTAIDLRQTKLDPMPAFALGSGALPADPCATGIGGAGVSRLAGSTVTVGQLPAEIWKYLDLSDAIFDPQGVPPAALTLQGKALCGSRLARVSLDRFELTDTKLDRSDLRGAKLTNVSGARTSLRGADLSGAKLDNATFTGAMLDGVRAVDVGLSGATFKGQTSIVAAVLTGCQAPYATFSDTDLSRSVFEGTTSTFYGATFERVRLDGATMSNVGLSFTTFTGGSMVGALLVQASFDNATFQSTSLIGVNARSAKFSSAKLLDVDLTNAVFARAASGSSAPASFERAVFCGGVLASTDLSDTLLTGALFPDTATPVPGPSGTTTTCLPVNVSGAKTSKDTICPIGAKPVGSTCAGAEWTQVPPPPPPCCVAPPGGSCPARKKPGKPCAVDCDCVSQRCLQTKLCAP